MKQTIWWSGVLLTPALVAAALVNCDPAAAVVEVAESEAGIESLTKQISAEPAPVSEAMESTRHPAETIAADHSTVLSSQSSSLNASGLNASGLNASGLNASNLAVNPSSLAPVSKGAMPSAAPTVAQALPSTSRENDLTQLQQHTSGGTPQRSTRSMGPMTSVSELGAQSGSTPNRAMSQLSSIDQLTDVQPTDWAYQALQSLVERYSCIVGYPDSTYRGQRALTRYEFAAGLNACLDRISELLAAATADLATKEDLAVLQRLQEEFAAELAALRGRVDVLEARTSALEANQFSTTTKLSGETLFFVTDIFNEEDEYADDIRVEDNQTVFQYRNRLIFDTSFSGTDQLRARLQAGTLEPFNQPGNEFGFGAFGNTDGNVVMDLLSYQFPVADFIRVNLFANGGGLDDATFGNTINPLDNPARSAISRFGQRNAIYRTANTSAGAAINFFLSRDISIQAAYLAGEASIPDAGSGLFNGNYGALGQLTFRNIFDRLDLAFTYVNAYTGTSFNPVTGSTTAGVPFGVGSRYSRVDADRPVIANSYGVEANLKILPGFQLGGWVGYSAVRAIGLGDADVWNYAATLAFPDLFGRGNLGGIIVGMQPRLTGSTTRLGDTLGRRKDPDIGLHVEAFYRYAVTENIDITPGIMWITAPNHNNDNNDLFMGVLRTTFRF